MMNSAAGSWISELEMDDALMYMDHHHQYHSLVDPFDDDDFASMFGQPEFDHSNYYWSPGTNSSSSSSSTLINNCDNMTPNPNPNPNPNTTNSINSFYTCPPTMELPHNPPNFTNTIINQDGDFILNVVNQNPLEQNFQELINTKTLVNNPEEKLHVAPQVNTCTDHDQGAKQTDQSTTKSSKKRGRVRPPSQTYDHIIAERRRREQLGQLFVSLSALVPGLKKMDKSSVLEDAIKYLKHLQERVKKLEQRAKKQAMESTVLVKRSQVMFDDDEEGLSSLSDDEVESGGRGLKEYPLPEIEARFSEGQSLIRVHCEKHRGILVKLLSKVETLNMVVVNTNATSFGNVALDITIIADLENEFNLTAKEVVAGLRAALLQASAGAAA